jgi:hypothetical protein
MRQPRPTVVTHVTDRRLGPTTRLIPLIDGYLPSDSIAIVVDEDNAYQRQFICRLVTELMKEESAGHQNAVLGTRSVVVPRSACTPTGENLMAVLYVRPFSRKLVGS